MRCVEITGLYRQLRSLVDWVPGEQYDLITCVHGIHYIGDKLRGIAVALGAQQTTGLFIGHLDLHNIKGVDARQLFAQHQVEYNSRRRLLKCRGPRHIQLLQTYEGADDQTGPNYTG